MKVRLFAVMLVAVMALAACGEDPAATDTAETASEPAAAASEPAADDSADAAGGAAIGVESSDLGDILVDAEGMTLYVFDTDTEGASTCYDDCAANWPALTGEVSAGDGVDESLLGTTERDDGETQVTYADKPLYYFAGDQAAGDTNGQAVGDVWWVVDPAGEAITGSGGAAADDSAGEESDGY